MASRFYFRNLSPTTPVSLGPWSNTLPGAAYWTLGYGNAALRTEIGALQVDVGGNSHGGVVHYDDYFRTFVSEALSAQTISAQLWTLALSTSEGGAGANSFTAIAMYVFRPSTGAVVGYIADADVGMGAEWGVVPTGQVMTFNGAQVVTALNDVLAIELWRHTDTPDDALPYSDNWQYNGTIPVTAGVTTDAASYIECPQSISLAAGGGATITGTIGMNAPVAQIAMSGRTSPGRVGTISMAAPSTTISMSGVATLPVAGVGRTFNKGYAYTRSDLEASVLANSSYNTCTLDHGVDPQPAHKEPVIDPVPGDAADTGSTRTLVHIQDPDGVWYTTSVMPPAR